MLKELISKLGRKDEKYQEMYSQHKNEKMIVQREKNSNERELERFLEEERQERIKQELNFYRKEKNKELFKNDLLTKEKVFDHKNKIMNMDSQMKGGSFYFR